MSKRRIRRKRRARVKILPLILVGAVIAGVITVIMSVNLKGADKEPPAEKIVYSWYITWARAELKSCGLKIFIAQHIAER